jgi:hypothetical protein
MQAAHAKPFVTSGPELGPRHRVGDGQGAVLCLCLLVPVFVIGSQRCLWWYTRAVACPRCCVFCCPALTPTCQTARRLVVLRRAQLERQHYLREAAEQGEEPDPDQQQHRPGGVFLLGLPFHDLFHELARNWREKSGHDPLYNLQGGARRRAATVSGLDARAVGDRGTAY